MNKLFLAASAAALLTVAGAVPSIAQSSSSSGATAVPMPMMTCQDLSALDQDTARNVLFYLGGLHAASSANSAMNAGSGTTTGSASTSADAGTTGSDTSTAGSGSSSTTADAGSSTAAGSSDTGSSDTTGSTTAAGSSSSGTIGTSGKMVAQLPGFSMINADQIMSTCKSSPDKQLSEVMGFPSGSTAQ